MNPTMRLSLCTSLVLVSPEPVGAPAQAQQNSMTFFITSTGPGKGADLGGLEGADRHCQSLAQAAGAGDQAPGAPTSARRASAATGRQRARSHRARAVAERQGRRHRQGCRRAARQQQSHQADGAHREGRGGQRPRRHAEPARHPDRLAAGRHAPFRPARTGPAATGRRAPRARPWSAITTAWGCATMPPAKSWNSSHPSRGPDGGCSQADLRSTGGDGLFYCFATN